MISSIRRLVVLFFCFVTGGVTWWIVAQQSAPHTPDEPEFKQELKAAADVDDPVQKMQAIRTFVAKYRRKGDAYAVGEGLLELAYVQIFEAATLVAADTTLQSAKRAIAQIAYEPWRLQMTAFYWRYYAEWMERTGNASGNKLVQLRQQELDFMKQGFGPRDKRVAGAYSNLGTAYQQNENLAMAERQYQEALRILEELMAQSGKEPDSRYATVLSNLGQVQYTIGNTQQGVSNIEKSLRIREKLTQADSTKIGKLAESYLAMAEIHRGLQEYGRAKNYLEKSLALFELQGGANSTQLPYPLLELARVCLDSDEIGSAQLYAGRAMQILQTAGIRDAELGNAHQVQANIYERQQRWQQAIQGYRQALDVYNQHFDPNQHTIVSEVYRSIAAAATQLGQPQYAYELLLKGLKSCKHINKGENMQAVEIYLQLAEWSIQNQQYTKAREHAAEALRITERIHPEVHPKKVQAVLQIGRANLPTDTAAAAAAAQQALDWCNYSTTQTQAVNGTVRFITQAVEALQLMALCQPEAAKRLPYYRQAGVLLSKQSSSYQLRQARQQLAQRTHQLYEEAVAATYAALQQQPDDPHLLDEALHFMEASRSQALLQHLHEHAALYNAGLPDSLIQRERGLQRYINYLVERPFDPNTDAAVSLRVARQQYDSLQLYIQHNYPQYYALRYEPPQASIASTKTMLQKGQVWIEYLVTRNHIYSLIVRPDKAILRQLPQPQSPGLSVLINQQLTAVDKDDHHLVQAAGRKLYDALIAPVANELNGHTLILVADGPLAGLNFDLLVAPEPSSQGQVPYLLRKYSLCHHYSAALYHQGRHRARARHQHRGVLGVAPLHTGSLPKLPGAEREVELVIQTVGGKTLTGAAATERAFRDQAGHYNLLLLSTHNILDVSEPSKSRLAFASGDTTPTNDGSLHVYEAYNLDLSADLIILSACHSGSGQYQVGEGIISMARAFAYGGCPNTVAAMWALPDLSTSTLVSNFVSYLHQGLPKAEALRQAKLELLDGNDRLLSRPRSWAGLVLVGDPYPILLKSRISSNTLLIGAILAAALIGFGAARYLATRRANVSS